MTCQTDKNNSIYIIWYTRKRNYILTIVSDHPRINSFYLFCGYIAGIRNWALGREYDTFMKILDHKTDLLLHLVRDASNDIIKLGQSYMTVGDEESAR